MNKEKERIADLSGFLGLKCRNGKLKPEMVGWEMYMVTTIRENFSLTTGKEEG